MHAVQFEKPIQPTAPLFKSLDRGQFFEIPGVPNKLYMRLSEDVISEDGIIASHPLRAAEWLNALCVNDGRPTKIGEGSLVYPVAPGTKFNITAGS